MEAISRAGTVLGVLAKDGVVLAAEKKVTGKLLDLTGVKEGGYGGSGEKIYLLNSCVHTILSAIANHLILVQKHNRRCRRDHIRCQLSRQLRALSSPKASVDV